VLNHLKLKHSSDISGWFTRERCDPNINPLKWWKVYCVSACSGTVLIKKNDMVHDRRR
jgi:hypothetical protein